MKKTCVTTDLRIFPMYIKTLGFASYAIEVVKCEGFLLLWPILHSGILHRVGFQMLATL